MYIQEISIAIKTDTDRAKLVESFEMLMSFYRGSGQIQGKIQSEYITKNKLCSLPYTHDKNALNPIFNNFYVLITDFISIASPITCGTCEHHVPLYRLPKYYDYGYMPILSWESNYQAADQLQMNCEVGERWGLNQMQSFKSQLSKQGLTICQKIEALALVPTYYFLFNYKKNDVEPTLKKCPNCNESWHLKERLHRFYDFKCDSCRIISTVSCHS
jgi:predicted  nucleic acid-binding Zn ribbon protein